eukprot:601525-Amphidinium_carterae.1
MMLVIIVSRHHAALGFRPRNLANQPCGNIRSCNQHVIIMSSSCHGLDIMLSASSCHHANSMPHVIIMSSCCQHVIFMVIIVSSLRHSVIMVAFSAQRSCKFEECAIIIVSSSVVVRQEIFERGEGPTALHE